MKKQNKIPAMVDMVGVGVMEKAMVLAMAVDMAMEKDIIGMIANLK